MMEEEEEEIWMMEEVRNRKWKGQMEGMNKRRKREGGRMAN
jgi:hypothetical protein